MSGKILSRVSALSLVMLLAACGGDGDSTPLVDTVGGTAGGTGEDAAVGNDGLTLGNGSNDSFNAGRLSASATNLSPGGMTLLEVSAVNSLDGNKLLSGQEIEITFSSPCIDVGRGSLSENPVTTTSGTAKVTYTATGCSGQDSVKAVAEGAEASIVLSIAPSVALTLTALQPEPNSIAPTNGSGNSQQTPRRASSIVRFQLEDKDQNGIQGAEVSFELFPRRAVDDTCPEQVGLNTLACIPSGLGSAITDSDGIASTTLIAGKNNEVVRVIATAESSQIKTTSAPIAINSYIPTAENFSLSIDNYLPDAWGVDNVPINVTISAADRYGTAIRGNTIVNFTTSNGAITPDCELNESGTCTVVWRSLATREPRPRITAYTQGETLVSGVDCDLPSTTNCTYNFGTIERFARITQSSSKDVQVNLTDEGSKLYCATTFVVLGDSASTSVPPPSGTNISFTVEEGKILNESQATKTIGAGSSLYLDDSYNTCVQAEADPTATETPIIKVLVTPPGGNPTEDRLVLQ